MILRLKKNPSNLHFKINPALTLSLFLSILFIGCETTPKQKPSEQKVNNLFNEITQKEKQGQNPEMKQLEKDIDTKTQISDAELNETKKSGKEKDEITFEETGAGEASKYERTVDAENRAEEDALNKALKKSGIDTYYGFTDLLAQYGEENHQFVAHYLYQWSNNLTEYEKIGGSKFSSTESGGTKCTLTIKGKLYKKGNPDPSFEIKTDLKDNYLGLDKPVYFSGDEINISFWLTKDAYITILNLDEEQNVYLVYPNKFSETNEMKAGGLINVPGQLGIALKATLPKNKPSTTELLHIIATKNQPLFTEKEVGETEKDGQIYFSLGEMKKVTQRLAKLNRSDWAMLVLPYEIREK